MTKNSSDSLFSIDTIKKNIINIIIGIVITAGTTMIFKSYSDQQKMIVELEIIKKDISIIKQQSDSQEAMIKALDKLTTRLEYTIERESR